MNADAVPALLRIRAVAALVLERAGYGREFIDDHLGRTTTVADPADITPELLTAAGHYLTVGLGCPGCGQGAITYWGVVEAIAKLRREVVPQPESVEIVPAPDPHASDHGVLFDVGVP